MALLNRSWIDIVPYAN